MTSLLIVDDDHAFSTALTQAFTQRGFEVQVAHNVTHAAAIAQEFTPQWALIDLKMPGASGLELIPKLLAIDPATRIVVLTGYGSITTAVEAIKLGAMHYLAKPVGMEEIIAAFHKHAGDPTALVEEEALTLSAAERDHILNVFERNKRNISATARELGLHRRTLQRKLQKI
jgi:two-component system response regulator RegA